MINDTCNGCSSTSDTHVFSLWELIETEFMDAEFQLLKDSESIMYTNMWYP